MNEVELVLGQIVLEQVVDADVEVRARALGDPSRVEVGREHAPLGPDAVAQPRGDRTVTGANLQAAPPRPHTARLEVADRARVEEQLEQVQPLALHGQRVVECVCLLVPILAALP